MGNTLLSHILYSCHKLNINLDDFFSNAGDAHKIRTLNTTNLLARHYQQLSTIELYICLIELFPNSIYNILRLKFSYEKWHKEYPTIHNFSKFNFHYAHEKNNDDYLESLTLKYYQIFQNVQTQKFENSKLISLESVINNDIEIVKDIIQLNLKWEWDDQRSLEFYQKMTYYNRIYLNWFDKIKTFYSDTCNLIIKECTLEFWEQAAIIAVYCLEHNINPDKLNWYNNCFFEQSNLNFIREMEKNNGKTI